jgi:hypothetical protein
MDVFIAMKASQCSDTTEKITVRKPECLVISSGSDDSFPNIDWKQL